MSNPFAFGIKKGDEVMRNPIVDLINKMPAESPLDHVAKKMIGHYSIIPFFTPPNQISDVSKDFSRAVASFLGMAIGDAFGAPYEFTHLDYMREIEPEMQDTPRWMLRPGMYTDDTSMGLCLADSLLENGGLNQFDLRTRFVAWWHLGYNNTFRYTTGLPMQHSVGLGGNISDSFDEFLEHQTPETKYGTLDTSGNGSLMRLAAVPVVYMRSIQEAMGIARLQSKTTHQGYLAAECCALMTFIMIRAYANGKDILHDLREFEKYLEPDAFRSFGMVDLIRSDGDYKWRASIYRYDAHRAFNHPSYIGSFCMDGLAMALHCVYTTTTFQDAIIKAAALGGDADTVAAITGQLAGAIYGLEGLGKIGEKWLEQVLQYEPHLITKAILLCNAYSF